MGRKRIPRLFLVSEVAEAFRVHPTNIRRLIQQGRLEAHRLGDKGSRWRVSEAAIGRFLLETRIGAGWLVRNYGADPGQKEGGEKVLPSPTPKRAQNQ